MLKCLFVFVNGPEKTMFIEREVKRKKRKKKNNTKSNSEAGHCHLSCTRYSVFYNFICLFVDTGQMKRKKINCDTNEYTIVSNSQFGYGMSYFPQKIQVIIYNKVTKKGKIMECEKKTDKDNNR